MADAVTDQGKGQDKGGQDKGAAGDTAALTPEEIKQLREDNAAFKSRLETQDKRIAEQDEIIGSPKFLELLAGGGGGRQEPKPDPEVVDWDRISPKDLHDRIVTTVGRLIDQKVGEVDRDVRAGQESQKATQTKAAVDTCEGRHKEEFPKVRARMAELSRQMPPGKDADLDKYVENLYDLAQLDDVRKSKVEQEEKARAAAAKPGSAGTEEMDLKPDDAVKRALSEVRERHARKRGETT